jgi:hypothetical protein
MEAAHNYENSAQSLRKAVRRSEKKIRGKERRRTGRIEEDGSFLTRIAIPRVMIWKRAIPLHLDRKKNGVRRHHDSHTDPKEQERRR